MEIRLFTDPACPFAFSAEPSRWRLSWHYGDQLTLAADDDRADAGAGGGGEARSGRADAAAPLRHADRPAPYPRPASSEPACRAVVAARLNAPAAEEALLRRLRVRVMAGGLLDDPALIAAAATDADLDPVELDRWCATPAVQDALDTDIRAARSPSRAARALDHKLGGPPEERRYTAPSYEIGDFALPGFHPVEAYEAAIANAAPELTRRPKPGSVEELLAWAGEPLATAEIQTVMGGDPAKLRAALARVAQPIASGADCYWRL